MPQVEQETQKQTTAPAAGVRPPERLLKACAWCGPAFVLVFFAGMLIAGYLPPPGPSDPLDEVVSFYSEDPTRVRLGLFLMMVAAGLIVPFVAVIAYMMRRAEGDRPLMTYVQLLGGAAGVVAVLVPVFIFTAVAFRPDRPAEITQALNDLAWLPFIMNIPPAIVQSISIAIVALGKQQRPVFARWVGYYNLWVAVLFVPGGLITFFKTGPLAWNGLLAFWLAATVFGTWFLVMSSVVRRAIIRS